MKCFIHKSYIGITDGIDYKRLDLMYRELKFYTSIRLRMDHIRTKPLLYIKIKTGVKLAKLRGCL